MAKIWQRSGNDLYLGDGSSFQPVLEKGIYKTMVNPMTRQIYLTKVGESFEFPYKIYGLEADFIKRMKKTFDSTDGNLGILLNGVKGTGKTVTSELICNELDLPVIIVQHTAGIGNFINDLPQDTCLLFDEYEKLYGNRTEDGEYINNDDAILSVMDGSLNNEFRKVFLLTTNNDHINDNLKQRPGRIRYNKTFADLPLETIIEIVKDKLEHPELEDKTVEFLSELQLITVDIVKSVIEEVNIHHEVPEKFQDIFNVKKIGSSFSIYKMSDEGGKEMMYSMCNVNPKRFTKASVGKTLATDYENVGKILEVISSNTIKVEMLKGRRYDASEKKVEAWESSTDKLLKAVLIGTMKADGKGQLVPVVKKGVKGKAVKVKSRRVVKGTVVPQASQEKEIRTIVVEEFSTKHTNFYDYADY